MENLTETVRERYAEAARRVTRGDAATCGCATSTVACCDPITSNLYGADEAGEVPGDALKASLGCGNPTALAALHPGETVLDLGSGGGIDVILSARRVGPAGKAYGLDMTDEMLALAEQNQRKAGRRRTSSSSRAISRQIPLPDEHGGRDHLELRHQPLRPTRTACCARRSACSSRAAALPSPTSWSAARSPRTSAARWSCGWAAWPAR